MTASLNGQVSSQGYRQAGETFNSVCSTAAEALGAWLAAVVCGEKSQSQGENES